MSILEEKIRKNKDLLDSEEPAGGHLERFQSKLDALRQEEAGPVARGSRRLFRVAAVAAALIGLSLVYYFADPARQNPVNASVLSPELQEAKMYYNNLAREKLTKIEDCASSTTEASYIRKIAVDELTLLDSNTVRLETELQNDQNNQRLINALIVNYKTKSDLLDDILKRLCHI